MPYPAGAITVANGSRDARNPAITSILATVPGLVRGVRLVFLAVAAAAAGAAWALGNALPLVIALVIAGIDVVETSFLLLVVAAGQVTREP